MTERNPWWKAFLPKKKNGGAKDSSNIIGPDFDPFAQDRQRNPDSAASKTSGNVVPSQQESNKYLGDKRYNGDDTYDDSQLDSVFNEQSCRRNMKVSRSGRFKVKGKVRKTLPIEEKDKEQALYY
ncbi:proline-rich protein 15 [Kryptolebias marmoratus]|uniref:proline-rich protein 15 n=1 Tax=Kryptolebias marmoratus TaxID=37003 RepID=UPI0007F8D4F8|nr:proline-rich protein 15 [Kryptolebias marmoratus]XP_017276243.1 proline-rich protein 15 [Kryptolebias marmoratus]